MGSLNEKVEAIQEISGIEKELLVEAGVGKHYSYIQYILRCTTKEEMDTFLGLVSDFEKNEPVTRSIFAVDGQGVEKKLVMKAPGNTILRRDISDISDRETLRLLVQVITAEMRRKYYPQNNYMMRTYVFKIFDGSHVCIFSAAACIGKFTDFEGLKKSMFKGKRLMQPTDSTSGSRHTTAQNMMHYKEVLAKAPGFEMGAHIAVTSEFEEIFHVDKELANLMLQTSEGNRIKMKAFCTAVWCRLLDNTLDFRRNYVAELRPGKHLDIAPFKMENRKSFIENFEDISRSYMDMLEYGNVTLEEVENFIGFKVGDSIQFMQCFWEQMVSRELFSETSNNIIYKIMPTRGKSVPFSVDYELHGDDPVIKYKYCQDIFRDISIESLHENFVDTMSGILRKTMEPTDVTEIKVDIKEGQDINTSRRNQQAVDCIRACSIFEHMSENMIQIMASKCSCIAVSPEQILIDKSSMNENLYIVGDGHIRMEYTNFDGIVTPVLMLRKGDVFGMESLMGPRNSDNIFTGQNENSTVLEIPGAVIGDMMGRDHQLFRKLLEYSHLQMVKLEKLWTMH